MDHNKLWKILKEMGTADHLTCLLRKLYAGLEATVRTGHGTTDYLSILKEISSGISFEGMMLKLKLQYFGHLRRRVDSLEKTLMLGGIGGRRRRG